MSYCLHGNVISGYMVRMPVYRPERKDRRRLQSFQGFSYCRACFAVGIDLAVHLRQEGQAGVQFAAYRHFLRFADAGGFVRRLVRDSALSFSGAKDMKVVLVVQQPCGAAHGVSHIVRMRHNKNY